MIKKIMVILVMVLVIAISTVSANSEEISFSCNVPYSLGKVRSTVYPGDNIRALFSIESRYRDAKVVTTKIELPSGVILTESLSDLWYVTKSQNGVVLSGEFELAGGYGHWFELIGLKCSNDLEPGQYKIKITVSHGEQRSSKEFYFSVQNSKAIRSDEPITLDTVLLPLDRDGSFDERLQPNTLNLRDQTLDYYKNILRGQGAVNTLAESAHPIAYMGLDFSNPASQQKMLLITAKLLDKNTGQVVAGLVTPASNVEDKDGGAFLGHKDRLVAFVALQDMPKERVTIPIYVDDKILVSGNYLLQVSAQEGDNLPIVYDMPITVIVSNTKAGMITSGALLAVALGGIFGFSRRQRLLGQMKTRWLVTIALFGTASFAMVNVPATFLNDVFHIILGPFGFLVTGLFHSVFLYMLIVSLLILLPSPGVVALMTMVRMLLSMLTFGHVSPVSILFYGVQAVSLEMMLYVGGITRDSSPTLVDIGWRKLVSIILICGLADGMSTYINLQALSFLYRLFYTDWYIMLCVIINGFLYTAVGAACGVYLGRELGKIGGD